MESSLTPTARRSEDIALDLLKFVSAHANLGSKSSSSTTGFGIPSTSRPEDQVAQIFDLYARCRAARRVAHPPRRRTQEIAFLPPIRIAVIGVGAFGRNHLRVYRELELAYPDLVQLAAVVDPDAARRAHFATIYNVPAFASVGDLLGAAAQSGAPFMAQSHRDMSGIAGAPFINAASVCVPTIHHGSVAEQLIRAGLDVLIEKPFAATLAEADGLITLARDHNRILAVGHLERFNPAVTATVRALNHPMFFEAHRLSIFTPRSLDVDVVLDLMIHDLDIVLSLTNSPVKEVRAVGLPILSPKTDIANVRLEFESGCVANFTASRVSTEQVRKLRLFQPHQYLSLDFGRQELLTISVDPNLIAAAVAGAAQAPATTTAPTTRDPGGLPTPAGVPTPAAVSHAASDAPGGPSIPAGMHHPGSPGEVTTPAGTSHLVAPGGRPLPAGVSHPTAGLDLSKADISKGEPLRLELENFLHSIRARTPPRVPAEAGRAALALALEINAQIAAHAHRAGLA